MRAIPAAQAHLLLIIHDGSCDCDVLHTSVIAMAFVGWRWTKIKTLLIKFFSACGSGTLMV